MKKVGTVRAVEVGRSSVWRRSLDKSVLRKRFYAAIGLRERRSYWESKELFGDFR